jgi:hypothetical protein
MHTTTAARLHLLTITAPPGIWMVAADAAQIHEMVPGV